MFVSYLSRCILVFKILISSHREIIDIIRYRRAAKSSYILKAKEMANAGELDGTPYIQFVMGVKNAMPADKDVFDYYVRTVKRLFGEDTPWCAAGIGRHQAELNEWAISAGGHARTGLEDNVRLDKDTLAPSNAALVERVVAICEKHQRPVATVSQARSILGV